MNEDFNPTELARLDTDRLKGYQRLLDFYHGVHWEGRERWGEKRLTFNYAKVVIDKVTSYLMSGVNFAVDALEDSTEARAEAQKAEVALRQIYGENNLEELDFETEIDWKRKLIVPSLAMPATRLSGIRRKEVSGLLLPIFRAYMPGGWGMIIRGCGG